MKSKENIRIKDAVAFQLICGSPVAVLLICMIDKPNLVYSIKRGVLLSASFLRATSIMKLTVEALAPLYILSKYQPEIQFAIACSMGSFL